MGSSIFQLILNTHCLAVTLLDVVVSFQVNDTLPLLLL